MGITRNERLMLPWSGRLEALGRFLPGGGRTVIHVATLSDDPRVRAVADRWRSLDAVAKIECRIGELCRTAGISDAYFIDQIDRTASELGIQRWIKLNGEVGEAFPLRVALGEALMQGHHPLPLITWPPTAWNRCREGLVAAWARRVNDQSAALRRRLRLSQLQFASLFLTHPRTVRRWEARLSALTTHQQYFLKLFLQFIEQHGELEFRRRFVREDGRYGKRGRPTA